MKKLLAALIAGSMVCSPAIASDRDRYRNDDPTDEIIVGAILGGLLGLAISEGRDDKDDRYYRDRRHDRGDRYYRDGYPNRPRYYRHYCVNEYRYDRHGREYVVRTCQ